jgi:hypothetical protein
MNNSTTIKNNTTPIIDAIVKQVSEGEDYPYLYSVIYFGFYDDNGLKLPPSIIRQFWDKEEVNKTCRIIYNSLKETFTVDGVWMFKERHADLLDENGEVLKKGKFHLNIITSNIKDRFIEEPNRKIRRLLNDNGRMNIPIKDLQYTDIDELKIELVNACIKRAAKWVNRFQYSIKTQLLLEPSDLEDTTLYCLKEFSKKQNPTDFTDVVCFKSSDFYKP